MLKRQRKLERECKLRDEKIQSLSMSLNDLNISFPRYYAPSRNTRSMYSPDYDDLLQYSPQVSRVAHMRHQTSTPLQYHDEMQLMGNNNNNNRPGSSSYNSARSHPTSRIAKNYYNTTINNPSQQRADRNVGIVKPNNARTTLTLDFEVPALSAGTVQPEQKKKKKKGIFRMLKLCGCSKSSQHSPPTREDNHKRPTNVAGVTTTAQQQYNTLEQSKGAES